MLPLSAALEAELRASLAGDPSLPGIIATVLAPRHEFAWSSAVGMVGHGSREPLTPDHSFRIASVTKIHVAAAVLRLVEQGRIDLFGPVAPWLSPDTLSVLAANGHPIDHLSPYHLLTHSAGLRDHGSHPDYAARVIADPGHLWTRAEQVELAMSLGPPLAPPGVHYSYSDTGYVVIGELIENVTGLSLAAAVRMLIDFVRLRLNQTYWQREEVPPEGNPLGDQYYGDLSVSAIDPSADLFGGGGLISTTGDLVRFLRSLLRGEVFTRPETLAVGLLTPAVSIGEATQIHSALLRSRVIGGRPCWSHGGFWGVQAVDFADIDVTLALTYNQVLCGVQTSGEIGHDGLVDRLARIIFGEFFR